MNEVKAAKHLGQHFLRDEAVIARLLAVINAKAGERILEIGPGLGALTLPLLRQIGALTAVEYDPRVLAPLAKKAATLGTLHLIHADILTINFAELLAAESPHSPADMPPPLRSGGGLGRGCENSAQAADSLPPPVEEGRGGFHPHTTVAESSTDAKKPLSLWDTQRSREARDRGWGEGEKSEGSKHPASASESLPSPCGGGVRLHISAAESLTAHRVRLGAPQETGTITALHSPTETPPPPVGEGWGGGSGHLALGAVDNSTDEPLSLWERGWGEGEKIARGGGSKHPAPATKKLRLVGNLPYNLSSPILFHCLAQRQHIHDMHYMLQKEVVDRITAAPGSKTYGRLSLMAQLWCETTALFDIPPDAFDPPPKVDSAVVRLVPRAAPAWQIDDLATFEETVRLAFAQRRKMLRKTFAHWMNAAALEALDIDPTARAETLDGAAYARLANARYQQERQQ